MSSKKAKNISTIESRFNKIHQGILCYKKLWVSANIASVKYIKAFKIDNIKRYFALASRKLSMTNEFIESRFFKRKIFKQCIESRFCNRCFAFAQHDKSVSFFNHDSVFTESRFYNITCITSPLQSKVTCHAELECSVSEVSNYSAFFTESKFFKESRFYNRTHKIKKLCLALLLAQNIYAAPLPFSFSKTTTDVSSEKDGLELDLSRIALNFSQATISNQRLYTNFSDSNLSGNSQLAVQFFLTFNANYYSMRFVSFNSMVVEYGFTEIRQNSGSILRNKNLDKLLFSSDYTQRTWDFDLKVESFEAGPFLRASYQTEFNPLPALGRRHIINYVAGAKMFDGKYVKSLYFDIFGEHDLNRTTQFNGFGVELGISLEYWLNKSIRFLYSMNYKHYVVDFRNSRIMPEYQFLIETRIEANLFKTLSISPTLRYYMLKAKDIEVPASNLILGVSLNFGKVLLPAQKPLNKYDFLY